MPVDLISVSEKLRTTGKLEESGGVSYLARLTDECPSSPNPEYHCTVLKEKYDLRRLIEIASGVIEKSFSQLVNPVEIVEQSQKELMGIGCDISDLKSVSSVVHGVIDKVESLQNNPRALSGLPTGFRDLDALTSGLQDTDYILLGARPSMGKTALALNICKNIALNGAPVLFFSIEMSKAQLVQRVLAEQAEINIMKLISGNVNGSEWEAINAAASILHDLPIYIEDKPGISVEEIISTARKMKLKHGIKFVCVDYVQYIRGWNKDGQGPKAEISRSLKYMAKSLNLPVLALSQLSRNLELRSDKHPINADLRESGTLEQDADLIMFLYRDEVYNDKEDNPNKGIAEIIIRKNRQGKTGTVRAAWIGKYLRFSNLCRY
jgi:replicative DNA helicase